MEDVERLLCCLPTEADISSTLAAADASAVVEQLKQLPSITKLHAHGRTAELGMLCDAEKLDVTALRACCPLPRPGWQRYGKETFEGDGLSSDSEEDFKPDEEYKTAVREVWSLRRASALWVLLMRGEALRELGQDALQGCAFVTRLELPAGVTSLGDRSCEGCVNLTEAVLPAGLESIGIGAFRGCKALSSLELPATLTSLDIEALGRCISLQRLSLPEGVTELSAHVLSGCYALTSLTLPTTLIKIGPAALRHCQALGALELPAGLTHIGASAFHGCSSLEEIVLPEAVLEVDRDAFQDCTALASVTLPASLLRVGKGAFGGCAALATAARSDGASLDAEALRQGKLSDVFPAAVQPAVAAEYAEPSAWPTTPRSPRYGNCSCGDDWAAPHRFSHCSKCGGPRPPYKAPPPPPPEVVLERR